MVTGVTRKEDESKLAYLKSKEATESLLDSIQSIVEQFEDGETPPPPKSLQSSLQESTKHLLTLKQCQRSLGLRLGSELSQELLKKRRHVENQALLLQNLLYERNHLLKEIRSCKRLECPHLLQMAKDELEMESKTDADVEQDGSDDQEHAEKTDAHLDDADADDDNGQADQDQDAESIIDRFLVPSNRNSTPKHSHREPGRHTAIMAKMHNELKTRALLHNQLLNAKKEKSALLEQLSKKRKFLSAIPAKISSLEKSVDALRGHFDDEEMNSSQDLMHVGFGIADDLERDEMAGDLSAPLYTLFVQFGSFIQAYSRRNDNDGENDSDKGLLNCKEWKLNVVDVEGEDVPMGDKIAEKEITQLVNHFTRKEEKALQLQIPTSSTGKDLVTIQFEYLPQLKIITAHVIQDKVLDSLWQGKEAGSVLLSNLFHGDTGKDLPLSTSSGIVYRDNCNNDTNDDDEVAVTDDASNTPAIDVNTKVSVKQMALWKIRQSFYNDSNKGKPFNWCQSIAGLNYPKSQIQENSDDELLKGAQIELSTKVVLLALYRRFRSHATLGILLKKLGKNRTSYHPSFSGDDNESPSAKDVLTKLASFEESNDDDFDLGSNCPGGEKVYCAIIKRKQKSLKIGVKIDVRYPSVPPLWSLQPTSLSTVSVGKRSKAVESHLSNAFESSGPLFDSTLGVIESRVNSLEEIGLYVKDDVEESYDWILMHQLQRIIVEWDIYQRILEEEEAGGSSSTVKSQLNVGRSRRGRDRRLTALYELYKHGL